MRSTENVVESVLWVVWDYWLKPAIYWWTYPFLRTMVPALRQEWDKYCTATLNQREREAREEEAGAVDLESTTFVDQATNPQIPVPLALQHASGIPQVLPKPKVRVRGKATAYPKGRKDLALRMGAKPRVRVRFYPPFVVGSNYRYVSYTYEDGRVAWSVQRIPGTGNEMGWVDEASYRQMSQFIEERHGS